MISSKKKSLYKIFKLNREDKFLSLGRGGKSMCDFLIFGMQDALTIKARQKSSILADIKRNFVKSSMPF